MLVAVVGGLAFQVPVGRLSGPLSSYGPKTVSAVPNAAAIVRRIWLPGLPATTHKGSRSMVAAFTSPLIAATASGSVAGRAG